MLDACHIYSLYSNRTPFTALLTCAILSPAPKRKSPVIVKTVIDISPNPPAAFTCSIPASALRHTAFLTLRPHKAHRVYRKAMKTAMLFAKRRKPELALDVVPSSPTQP